jgi:RNA recognition motif-containing protein
VQLPWSTSNEDLVELFTTIGKVERAEIQYEPNGRSRGTGVVEFSSADDAETAIGMWFMDHLLVDSSMLTNAYS